MSRKLPPLNGLKAFEAAARHRSFTGAARELHVTQAAVSQQVKQLEQHLGLGLFRRSPRGLTLTEAGQTLLPKLTTAFDLMQTAARDVYDRERQGALTVRVPSSLSILWLAPRIDRFHALCPNIDLRLTALGQIADFSRDDIDLEIRYGFGDWPGLDAVLMLNEDVFPGCSPELLSTDPPLTSLADLGDTPLIHVTGYPHYAEDWSLWLEQAGQGDLPLPGGYAFDQSAMALQAAAQGAGIALGRSPLVEGDLISGRLVAPFEFRLPGRGAYWIVYPSSNRARPRVVAFRDWLLAEATPGAP